MIVTKTCVKCGVEFDCYGRAQYCPCCRKIVSYETGVKWREANKEKYKAYLKEYQKDYAKGIKRKNKKCKEV